MAETRERPEWIGGLISFLRGHAHAYSSESKERAQLERYIQRLATLSTPREPEVDENLGDEIRGALRLTDKLRRWIIREVGVESGIDAIDLTSHLRAHLDSAACIVLYSGRSPSPYTDEDDHQRCHLGGCRVELVDEDEGTCYYRVVEEGDE